MIDTTQPSEIALLTDIRNTLESTNGTLLELVRWARFANTPRLRDVLQRELETDTKKLAYENTDGAKGLEEIKDASGAPRDTIYSWWQKWFRLGIVVESRTRKGRMMKIISLDDVGLTIPRRGRSKVTDAAVKQASGVEEPARRVDPRDGHA